jgi:hypothetical protein
VPRAWRAPHQAGGFLDCQETASNDFVLQDWRVELLSSDIADWSITFVATGLESPIGERLRRVRRLLEGEEMFLANYADVLTDAPLDAMVAQFTATPDAGVTPSDAVAHRPVEPCRSGGDRAGAGCGVAPRVAAGTAPGSPALNQQDQTARTAGSTTSARTGPVAERIANIDDSPTPVARDASTSRPLYATGGHGIAPSAQSPRRAGPAVQGAGRRGDQRRRACGRT